MCLLLKIIYHSGMNLALLVTLIQLSLSATATASLDDIDRSLLSFLSKSGWARGKAIDLIVKGYTSDSCGKDLDDRFDHAIDAIQATEMDGEPIPIQGHDFLFVGSVGENSLLVSFTTVLPNNHYNHITDTLLPFATYIICRGFFK